MVMDPHCELITNKSTMYNALLSRMIEQIIARLLSEDGCAFSLCVTDYKFLSAVSSSDTGSPSMTELAHQLHLHPSSATRRVRHLQACGLITKTQDETDDRRYFIALTQEGASLTARIDGELLALMQRMYSVISDEEIQAVYAFMDKCVSFLESALSEEER